MPFPADSESVKAITSRRLCADDFTTEKVIGRGAFGEVQLVSVPWGGTDPTAFPKQVNGVGAWARIATWELSWGNN